MDQGFVATKLDNARDDAAAAVNTAAVNTAAVNTAAINATAINATAINAAAINTASANGTFGSIATTDADALGVRRIDHA
jgi:hypothetical protein